MLLLCSLKILVSAASNVFLFFYLYRAEKTEVLNEDLLQVSCGMRARMLVCEKDECNHYTCEQHYSVS